MFEPGDEVVIVKCEEWKGVGPRFNRGAIYIVEAFYPAGHATPKGILGADGVVIVGMPSSAPFGAWDASAFRKIDRRSDLLEVLMRKPVKADERDQKIKHRERA